MVAFLSTNTGGAQAFGPLPVRTLFHLSSFCRSCVMFVGSRLVAVCCGLFMLASLMAVGGCGKGETILKATVTYDGKPVKSGGIELNSKPGRSGATAENGVVIIKNVPAGKWKVRFVSDKDVEPVEAQKNKKIQD